MLKYLLITGCILLFNFLNTVQISTKHFFNDFLSNTTHIDLYNTNQAYIYLNNQTVSKHFLQLENSTEFKLQLDNYNYEYTILNKVSRQKYLETIMSILFLVVLLSAKMGISSISNFIEMDNKVKITLEDVAGLDDAKKEIFEFIDFIKHREKYLQIGARLPRGALLYGPPGTGKTLLAKAIAGECNISFISVAGPDFSELYIGIGASRVRSLFAKARAKAPCVIFIDEIDALARTRDNKHSHHDKDNTLNRLLIELDGFTDNDNIIVFAATNRLEILDKALLRPGRFDRKIEFTLPEKNDRKKIFEYYLSKIDTEENIDSELLAKQSFGFSGADIANICNEACILAIRNDQENISHKLLLAALDNILLGPEKKTFKLSPEERTIVAYHESGHACMSYLLKDATKSVKVSILPRGKSALGFSQSEVKETKLKSKEEILAQLCVLFGGRVAEEIFCDSITTGASDDIQKLTKLAYAFIYTYGMNNYYVHENMSDIFKHEIDKKIQAIINTAYIKTKKLLTKHKAIVEQLKTELLEKEILHLDDLEKILKL